jgi:hypothetical protein
MLANVLANTGLHQPHENQSHRAASAPTKNFFPFELFRASIKDHSNLQAIISSVQIGIHFARNQNVRINPF